MAEKTLYRCVYMPERIKTYRKVDDTHKMTREKTIFVKKFQ